MKSFLLAAALQEKAVRPEDRFDCEGGAFQIGSRVIHDAHPYNVLTVAETVKFSSNICSAKIGLKLGREKLHRYLRGFGFGEPAEISLPAESRGILPPAGSWADINTATISFGQGVSVSAVQLAGAFAAIANGGNLMRPRIVRRVVTRRGEIIKEFTPEVRRRVISPEVAAKVTEILATVTEQGGTGTAAAVDGFSVAGKTGTAQKVDSATKGYSADKRIGLFAGFVPASAPKLVVVVAVDEPKGIAYGGVVAAPAFKTIATVALKNLGIFPMPGPAKTGSAVPEAGGDDESREGSGDGYVGEDIAPRTGAAGTVPNFLGLPVREAIELGVGAGVEIEVEGTGRAVSQKPAPGSKYRQGSVCRVVFSRG
jgi:cell division protein FtsI (penicillin-binding protein 3)